MLSVCQGSLSRYHVEIIKLKLISNIQIYGTPLKHRKIKLLRLRNQKIREFVRKFCCILYEILPVDLRYEILHEVRNYCTNKGKIQKIKSYRYFIEKTLQIHTYTDGYCFCAEVWNFKIIIIFCSSTTRKAFYLVESLSIF